MKKYLLLGVALLLIAIFAFPFVQRIASTKTLDTKVQEALVENNLKELPESLQMRVEGTDWFFAGYACPYSSYTYSQNPNTGEIGEFDSTLQSEAKNVLLYLHVPDREITYVQIDRSTLDVCGQDSVKPTVPVID
jgi:hypothetical protein